MERGGSFRGPLARLGIMKVTAFVILLALSMVAVRPAAAEWQALTDEELDEITAGDVQMGFTVDGQTVSFSFGAGSTVGNGSVSVSPVQQASSTPNTAVFNGATLSNSTFLVNNMVFNLNICAMCRANSILQQGIGIPVTVGSQ